MGFTLTATVPRPHGTVLARVRELLPDAGFGVLTEIDIQATLRAKLGVETPPKVILGACRPQLALRAMQADPRTATLLPCSVVVSAEGTELTRVEAFDPGGITAFSDAAELAAVAAEARERLSWMLSALGAEGKDSDATRV